MGEDRHTLNLNTQWVDSTIMSKLSAYKTVKNISFEYIFLSKKSLENKITERKELEAIWIMREQTQYL